MLFVLSIHSYFYSSICCCFSEGSSHERHAGISCRKMTHIQYAHNARRETLRYKIVTTRFVANISSYQNKILGHCKRIASEILALYYFPELFRSFLFLFFAGVETIGIILRALIIELLKTKVQERGTVVVDVYSPILTFRRYCPWTFCSHY